MLQAYEIIFLGTPEVSSFLKAGPKLFAVFHHDHWAVPNIGI